MRLQAIELPNYGDVPGQTGAHVTAPEDFWLQGQPTLRHGLPSLLWRKQVNSFRAAPIL
jgi:hypothetical protein